MSVDDKDAQIELPDRDLSIVLAQALRDDRPFSRLELANFDDKEIYNIGSLIQQEIGLRRIKTSPTEADVDRYCLWMSWSKHESLTQLMNKKNTELTSIQIDRLLALEGQVKAEKLRRIYEEMRPEREAREAEWAARDAEWAARDAEVGAQRTKFREEILAQDNLHKAVAAEFGSEAVTLSALLRFGEENIPPSRDSWGVMTVSLADGQDAAMAFVRAHARAALDLRAALQRENEAMLLDRRNDEDHFSISKGSERIWFEAKLTPDFIDERARAIQTALLEEGGCGIEKYPNLFDKICISLSNKDDIHFLGGGLSVEVDVKKSLEDNLAKIREAANDGNPKSIRQKWGISSNTDFAVEMDARSDKLWLLYSLQREQDGNTAYPQWEYLFTLSDKNIMPSMESWGRASLDLHATEEATRAFILSAVAAAKQITQEIEQTAREIEERSYGNGFSFFTEPDYRVKDLPPPVLFAKEAAVISLLKAKGGFQPDNRHLQISMGSENKMRRQDAPPLLGGEIVSIECDVHASPSDIVNYVVEQAKANGFRLAS